MCGQVHSKKLVCGSERFAPPARGPMTKVVYKRCSLTLDTETIRKNKELANQKAQSVSSFVRYLVGQALMLML
jgi:hypothetical protein